MSTGWGAARSCRPLLVVLLALLVPLAAVVMDGDRWLTGPVDLSAAADRPVDTLTDRAPPVAAPLLAQSALNRSTIPHARRM